MMANTIIARRISSSGWAWFTTGRNGQIISPEIPEEHLKNFSMIVQGSLKSGWGSETVYEVVDEHDTDENDNGGVECLIGEICPYTKSVGETSAQGGSCLV